MIRNIQTGNTETIVYTFKVNAATVSLTSVEFILYTSTPTAIRTLILGTDEELTETSTGIYEVVLETDELAVGTYYAELSGHYAGYKYLKRDGVRVAFY